jgi:nitrite reductase/ring-hydroxylating ferredoxin subunit
MAENILFFPSTSLEESGLGIRFNMPMYGAFASGFLIRFQGKAYAYVNQCAHVPVELDWKEGEFFTTQKDFIICATHGAHYRPDNGFCVMGPCKGRSLKPIAVKEENEKIAVDLNSAAQYFS